MVHNALYTYVVINYLKMETLKKLFKGNIFTDLIWLLVGIAGGINYFLKGRYWAAGAFAFLAILYLIKIASPLLKGREVGSDSE